MDASNDQRGDAAERLIGRDSELRSIANAIERATRTQSGAFLMLAGQPGMGRTELANAARQVAESHDLLVVDRPCWPDHSPSGWPWRRVLEDVGVEPLSDVGLEPVVDTVDALVERCERRPTLVVLDDLHHASRDTLLFTRLVARSLRAVPLVLVATWRGDVLPSDDLAADIWRAADALIVLEPLGQIEVDALLDRSTEVSPQRRRTIERQAGGNPLFVRELARAGDASSRQVPIIIDDVIRSSFEATTPGERRLALATTVFGQNTPLRVIASVLATNTNDVLETAAAIGALVRLDGSTLRPTSELVVDTVRRIASTSEIKNVHRAVVACLDPPQDASEASLRASHALAIGLDSEADSVVAVEACRVASQALARAGLLNESANQLERAVAFSRSSPEMSLEPELLFESADALLASGRLGDARERFDEAAASAQAAADQRLVAKSALGLGGIWVEEQRDAPSRERLLGLLAASLAFFENEASLGLDDRLLQSRLRVRFAAERVYSGDAVVADVEVAVNDLRDFDDPRTLAESLSLLHHTMLTPHHAHRRLAVADALLNNAASAGDILYGLMGQCWRAVDLFLLGDPGADAALEELRTHAVARGCRSIEYIVAVLDAMRSFCRGDLEQAEALTSGAFDLGTEVGDADAFAYFGGQLVALRWAQGRVDEIRPMVDDLADSPTMKRRDVVFAAVSAGAAALGDDADAARRWLDRVGPVAEIPMFSTWLTTMFALSETAYHLDDRGLASELLPLLRPFSQLPVRASLGVTCLGPTTRLIGLLQATIGDIDAATLTMEQAATDVRRLGNRPVEAILAADRAALLKRRGRPGDEERAADLMRLAIDAGASMGLTNRVAAWRSERSEPLVPSQLRSGRDRHARLCEQSDHWKLERDGLSFEIPNSVGVRHLAILLSRPDVEVAAIDLSTNTGSVEPFSSMPLIDNVARRQYRQRIVDLEEDIIAADAAADLDRGSLLRAERDSLIVHLAASISLTGRTRATSDHHERARMRVTKALRRCIAKIQAIDPIVGSELSLAVRTGSSCMYVTEPSSRRWTVDHLHGSNDRQRSA